MCCLFCFNSNKLKILLAACIEGWSLFVEPCANSQGLTAHKMGSKIDTAIGEAIQYKCGNLQQYKYSKIFPYDTHCLFSFCCSCMQAKVSRCIKPGVCSCSKLTLPSMTYPYDRHQSRIRVSFLDILSSMILIDCFLVIYSWQPVH